MQSNLKVLFLGTAKGGSGKTTVADALAAGAAAAEKPTLVVDVDNGNSGFRRRAGKSAALSLSWTASAGDVDDWMQTHLASPQIAIFDLGANLTASDAPVTEFLGDLVIKLRSRGAQVIFMPIASPNAPGTGGLIEAMREEFESLGDIRIVENNVDGSGAFSRSLKVAGLPKASFPHLDPGIQAVRMLRAEALIDVLRKPTPGYEKATARLASRLNSFLVQEPVAEIFGGADVIKKMFGPLADGAPTNLRFMVKTIAEAGNQRIEANERLCLTHTQLKSSDRSNRDAVFEAALAFIEAEDAYYS